MRPWNWTRWILAAALLLAVSQWPALWPAGPVVRAADGDVAALRARIAELEATELALRRELARERSFVTSLRTENSRLRQQLQAAEDQVARLRSGLGFGPNQSAPPIIRLQVGRPEIQVGDLWYASDVPPTLVDGRIVLPVRAIAELMGFGVEWDGQTRTLTLIPGAGTPPVLSPAP